MQGILFGELRVQASGEGGPVLAPRELEVLRLIGEGLSARRIGERLYIATSTVKSHQARLYEKLGVSDRAAAVAEGMRLGLLE